MIGARIPVQKLMYSWTSRLLTSYFLNTKTKKIIQAVNKKIIVYNLQIDSHFAMPSNKDPRQFNVPIYGSS